MLDFILAIIFVLTIFIMGACIGYYYNVFNSKSQKIYSHKELKELLNGK